MNSMNHWADAFEAMPEQQFFKLIRLYLGEVQTPYNRQRLISQLASFIKNAEDEACGQVQILPVILSKGLEFDTVIVIENGGLFNSELGTNLRYIACTRAINKLYVLKHKD